MSQPNAQEPVPTALASCEADTMQSQKFEPTDWNFFPRAGSAFVYAGPHDLSRFVAHATCNLGQV